MPRKQTLIARHDLPVFVKQESNIGQSSQQLLNLTSICPRPSTQRNTNTTNSVSDFCIGGQNIPFTHDASIYTPQTTICSPLNISKELKKPQVIII